jgi:hypothetical protein
MCGKKFGISTRIAAFFLVFVSVVLPTSQVRAQSNYMMMGNVNSYSQDNYNITFHCDNGKVRLSFLTDYLVRIHMAPAGSEFPVDDLHLDENGPYFVVNYTWPGVTYKISEDKDAGIYTIQAGKVMVKASKAPFKLAFYDSKGNLLVKECGLRV